MDKVKGYIKSLSSMLNEVFSETEKTVDSCTVTISVGKDGDAFPRKYENHTDVLLNSLRESINSISALFQFGDIIDQSFESFTVIFDEIGHLQNDEIKLTYDYAERFSKLIGAVSNNTFFLIATTLLQLREKLEDIRKKLCLLKEEMKDDKKYRDIAERFAVSVDNSLGSVEKNILKIETSAKFAVLSTENMGLFCVDKVVSRDKDRVGDDVFTMILYDKFRVREHLKILNSIFPSSREYSETGSMEFF